MQEEFKEFINEFINKCDTVLSKGDVEEARRLQSIILNTFNEIIPKIGSNLHRSLAVHSTVQIDYLGNIEKLKNKLKVFLISGGVYSDTKASSVVVNANSSVSGSGNSTNTVNPSITNNNTNTNNQTVNNTFDFKLELDKVREEVEADEVLGEKDKEEINEKLNEIEEVMNGSPTNNEKWKKLKGVVNWVTTKGFKIGKMIMPIITKALFPEE